MILGKADLEKLAGSYAEQAKKAYDNYQETGQLTLFIMIRQPTPEKKKSAKKSSE